MKFRSARDKDPDGAGLDLNRLLVSTGFAAMAPRRQLPDPAGIALECLREPEMLEAMAMLEVWIDERERALGSSLRAPQ